jgi:lipopolysaccharide/colanic/teichoic acid biosynthesis glycosyltransferase/nucleoside-diphosphate-sugar epimerase
MTEVESELQGKRVMVTGAAGFVGSRLVEELLAAGAEVLALVDKNTSIARVAKMTDNRKLHLISGSLKNAGYLLRERPKWGSVNYLVHLWVYVPPEAGFGPQTIKNINMNLVPTMNLVQALDSSIGGICFASSVSVYGYPARLPLKESDIPAPVTSYGATKLAIENYLQAYGRSNAIPVAILRYATIYGPGELKHRAIPNFISNIAGGQPPIIYGDGSEIHDYVYIDDAVRATVLAVAGKPNGVFNIGSGCGYSTLEIARKIINLYPAEMNPRFIPGKNQNLNIVCDISAAREALSYSPRTDIEDGLAWEIEWHKKEIQKETPGEEGQRTGMKNRKGRFHLPFDYSFLKNVIDRITAFLVLTLLSPLMAVIALAISIDSHGHPIFSQERVGKDGRKFTVYKFRTMHANNDDGKYKEYLKRYVLENAPYRLDENGRGIFKVDDNHFTKFGSWLRRTNLDELPQFVNILKGDMSLIGPRPDVPFAVQMYQDWHRNRLRAKPGITGLWQVCGRKGLSFNEMASLDIEYIKKQSLLLDTKIFILTVGTILKMDGS